MSAEHSNLATLVSYVQRDLFDPNLSASALGRTMQSEHLNRIFNQIIDNELSLSASMTKDQLQYSRDLREDAIDRQLSQLGLPQHEQTQLSGRLKAHAREKEETAINSRLSRLYLSDNLPGLYDSESTRQELIFQLLNDPESKLKFLTGSKSEATQVVQSFKAWPKTLAEAYEQMEMNFQNTSATQNQTTNRAPQQVSSRKHGFFGNFNPFRNNATTNKNPTTNKNRSL